MSRATRSGFTLIELLVVISILGVLATLTVVYVLPAFSDNKNVIRGVDRVTTTLLIAKQRALREGHPVGVRFELSNLDSSDPLYDPAKPVSRRMRYIEQPEIFSGKSMTLTSGSNDVTLNDFDLVGSATAPADYEVQPGDWLRLAGPPTNTSFNLEIVNVGPDNSLTPVLAAKTVRVRNAPGGSQSNGMYWLVRQARPIPGEDVVEMPQNVIVNLNALNVANANYAPVVGGRYDIVFGPAGGVFSRATATPLILWVHDETKPAGEPATARLIGIYPRTGLVGAHEINQSGDPLAFALDGKSSGL